MALNNENILGSQEAFFHMMQEHVHTAQKVYPTLADAVSLATEAGDWALGTITEVVPVNTIAKQFDIHGLIVEDVNTTDKTYEVVLYYGGSDTECGRVRFSSFTNKGGVHTEKMQTVIIPANSKVSAALAIQDGGSKTATVSIRYHEYD